MAELKLYVHDGGWEGCRMAFAESEEQAFQLLGGRPDEAKRDRLRQLRFSDCGRQLSPLEKREMQQLQVESENWVSDLTEYPVRLGALPDVFGGE